MLDSIKDRATAAKGSLWVAIKTGNGTALVELAACRGFDRFEITTGDVR
jgi:hypothetical protein